MIKTYIIRCMALLLPLLAVACSETSDDVNEVENWQERNEAYFNNLYETAKSDTEHYKLIRCWSLEPNAAVNPDDYIIAEVLNEGKGTQSPIGTDSVCVHYRGRFIPTASYSDGYVFDQSWTGEYNLQTMRPAKFAVAGLVDGFTTALLYMKPGDRWRVTIPYKLAYGASDYTTGSSTIPAYTTLIFDITLVSFYHPGATLPPLSAKPHLGWIGE